MDEVMVKDDIKIENLIYEIRGRQVMLDSDLAKLYKCKNGTKDVNKAVKRNLERFPDNFMFRLTNEEYGSLRFQIGTLKSGRGQHKKYLPFAFTEQGVAMLASVLHTDTSIKVSISIMNAFVAMRKYISSSLMKQKYINNLVLDNNEQIKEIRNDVKLLQESFDKLEEKRKINEIYFNGQIYDAYAKIKEIFNISKKKLIIIDSYADNTILNIIKNINVEVIMITKKDNLLSNEDINRYNKQYHNLKVIYNNIFHDRYFLIADNILYHCGASINRIGYKTFSINLITDSDICKMLMDRVSNIN